LDRDYTRVLLLRQRHAKAKKKLEELQAKLSGILHEVELKRLTHFEAANRVVEIREEMDDLIQELKKSAKKNKMPFGLIISSDRSSPFYLNKNLKTELRVTISENHELTLDILP
jgi:hypothetical protein